MYLRHFYSCHSLKLRFEACIVFASAVLFSIVDVVFIRSRVLFEDRRLSIMVVIVSRYNKLVPTE